MLCALGFECVEAHSKPVEGSSSDDPDVMAAVPRMPNNSSFRSKGFRSGSMACLYQKGGMSSIELCNHGGVILDRLHT